MQFVMTSQLAAIKNVQLGSVYNFVTHFFEKTCLHQGI